jgi:hypothetical protein
MDSARANDGTVIINPQTADHVGHRVSLQDIDHPVVLDAWSVWNEQRGDGKYPSKAIMTPRRMKSFLRNVVLIAATGDKPDYEYRIFGDAAAVAFGHNYTGMRIDALNKLQPGYGDVMERLFNFVRRTASPLFVRGTLTRALSSIDEQQAVFLPLGAGDVVDHILYVGGYRRVSPKR